MSRVPVLRVLAIVTLAFGEIVRLVLINWVDLTNGGAKHYTYFTAPAGHTFIGVWRFEDGGLEHGAVDLLVRYDDALAAEAEFGEGLAAMRGEL